jgi:hypothetical protein
MPIIPPSLDDRSYDELVRELLNRVPAHTREWADVRPGDPGRTLIELFAFLADSILYRANLVPERQRMVFLRLLGIPMRPAIPARTLITLSLDDPAQTSATILQPLATVSGSVDFETTSELTVLPVTAEAYAKRALSDDEDLTYREMIRNLGTLYLGAGRAEQAKGYVTMPVFPGGAPEADGFDLVGDTVDKCLWLALLAPEADSPEDQPAHNEAIRQTLGSSVGGGQQLISVGTLPAITMPEWNDEDIGPRAALPHIWEITGLDARGQVIYTALDQIVDTTAGLTRRGYERLVLPGPQFIGAPSNDVRQHLNAGTGDMPPRLDDPEKAARLVAWVRLRPTRRLESLRLSWVGINAVEIDQRQTITARIVGTSDGGSDQQMALPAPGVDPESLEIQVEENGQGFVPWQRIDDINLAGRDDRVYVLDEEAGSIRFGDRVRGRVPAPGRRVRVAFMRAGGGVAGNLPPGSLTDISARDLEGRRATGLVVHQPLAAEGGLDAETLAEAEQRIPQVLRHRERTVTAADYRAIAAETPGLQVGRVELLPRFKPHQMRENVPGVVSVMVLPYKPPPGPGNPRPDRPFLETVYAHLEPRRPLGTELYVIGVDYVPLGLSVGVEIADGFDREDTLRDVRLALRQFLWPLFGGGPQGTGWPLGKTVEDRELELVAARVPGVQSLIGDRLNIFVRNAAGDDWEMRERATANALIDIPLDNWQLPELLSVVAVADDAPPTDLRGVPNPFDEDGGTVPIPIVPEVCN